MESILKQYAAAKIRHECKHLIYSRSILVLLQYYGGIYTFSEFSYSLSIYLLPLCAQCFQVLKLGNLVLEVKIM